MASFTDIRLTGLTGSNPLGALAAFGLLRVCSEIPEVADVRLLWKMEDDWVAVLRTGDEIDKDKLVMCLSNRQKALSFDVFNWNDDIREIPADYRSRLVGHLVHASRGDRLEADYFVAFGSEMATDGSKGLVKPTAFHMTSGQQKFLKIAKSIGESLLDNAEDAINEALFGPWQYTDRCHSLGWDPATERMHALRHKAPTSESPYSVKAAVWLALESLPMFPTAPSGKRLKTTGFLTKSRETVFSWPIWKPPIGLDTLRTLLATSEIARENEDWEALGRRGVAAIYQSERSKFGKGYAIFKPATLLWIAH